MALALSRVSASLTIVQRPRHDSEKPAGASLPGRLCVGASSAENDSQRIQQCLSLSRGGNLAMGLIDAAAAYLPNEEVGRYVRGDNDHRG
jgi:hypothetical protein